jgi:hypothetical protein
MRQATRTAGVRTVLGRRLEVIAAAAAPVATPVPPVAAVVPAVAAVPRAGAAAVLSLGDAAAEVAGAEGEADRVAAVALVAPVAQEGTAAADAVGAGDRAAAALAGRSRAISQRSRHPAFARDPRL